MRRDDFDWNHEAATEAWEHAHAPDPWPVDPEYDVDPAPEHTCDDRCREFCASFSAAIKKYTRRGAA